MLSTALEDPSWTPMLERAALLAGVSVERGQSALSWWRRDLVLVGPGSPLLAELPRLTEHWMPMVVGVGEPPSASARIWCEAWVALGDEASLALLLPRAMRNGAQRRRIRQQLAHDLRGPIGVISGYCELLSEELLGPLEAKQQSAVDKVCDQNDRLLQCLDDLAPIVGAPPGVQDPTARQV